MRVLLWHVHGSWTTSFVQGGHDYLVPVVPDRGPDGRGRARTWDWPANVVEVPLEALREQDIDVVVLQRPRDLELLRTYAGAEPGRDLPAVYVEHDTPRGGVPLTRHLLADRTDIPVAHVTGFNALLWDSGRAPVTVVEHGIVDPGQQWTGELPRLAAAVNEPVRRGRVAGADLIAGFSEQAPIDVFGMGLTGLHEAYALDRDRVALHEDPPQHAFHAALARRRVYVHPFRWTSLGLTLIEAMQLGMPVVAVGATEAYEAVPPGAGVVSTDPVVLHRAVREFLLDKDIAAAVGAWAGSSTSGTDC
jgi:hypothetical protein